MKGNEELIVLSEEIKGTQKILTALGDEMRQHLILVMTQSGNCSGMRCGCGGYGGLLSGK